MGWGSVGPPQAGLPLVPQSWDVAQGQPRRLELNWTGIREPRPCALALGVQGGHSRRLSAPTAPRQPRRSLGSPAPLQQNCAAATHCAAGPVEPEGLSGCISATSGLGTPAQSAFWGGTGVLVQPDMLCPTAAAGLGTGILGAVSLGSPAPGPWGPAMREALGCWWSIPGGTAAMLAAALHPAAMAGGLGGGSEQHLCCLGVPRAGPVR